MVWKNIEGYSKYQLNIHGQVRNVKTGRLIKHWVHTAGYYAVELCESGCRKKHLVHRLIAEAFLDNPHNKDCVNHIDGNKKNNDIGNLEWCSKGENNVHAIEVLGKLRKQIRCVETGKVFESMTEASRVLGIGISSISVACSLPGKKVRGFSFALI